MAIEEEAVVVMVTGQKRCGCGWEGRFERSFEAEKSKEVKDLFWDIMMLLAANPNAIFHTLILSEPPPTKPGMAGDERERVSGRDDKRDERIFLKTRTLQTTLFLCTQSPRRINF